MLAASVNCVVIYTDEMQRKNASVKSALIEAQSADKFESIGEYDRALECYQAAVELLLPMIEGIYLC